jgi:hypothetical protein
MTPFLTAATSPGGYPVGLRSALKTASAGGEIYSPENWNTSVHVPAVARRLAVPGDLQDEPVRDARATGISDGQQ